MKVATTRTAEQGGRRRPLAAGRLGRRMDGPSWKSRARWRLLAAACLLLLLAKLAAELTKPASAASSSRSASSASLAAQQQQQHHHAYQDQHQQPPSQKHHKHHQKHSRRHTRRHTRRRSQEEFVVEAAADRPVVATKKGLVRGIGQKLFTGKFVDAFLGVPYAQPPLGKFRFRHPQPMNPWQGVRDASRLPNSCYQVNDTYFGNNFSGTYVWNANTPLSEDCLYLNVWTPFGVANITTTTNITSSSQDQQAETQQKLLRPVLVWIFGGGFYSGTSSLALYEGGVLASEEDVIVVSMNYRVNALGFLYFGRPDAPGNAGLFDQLMALEWVQAEIERFGGDPKRVTLFGESAGAVSVAYHLLSPLSRHLFARAILQSGAATCPWCYMERATIERNGLQLAQKLGCPHSAGSEDQMLECLRQADPMRLVAEDVGNTRALINFPFVPVVDGSFLLDTPSESLAKANFKRTNILLGSNYDEGNSWLIYLPEFNKCTKLNSSYQDYHQQATTTAASPTQQMSTVTETSSDEQQLRAEGANSPLEEPLPLLAAAEADHQQGYAIHRQPMPLEEPATGGGTLCRPREQNQLSREEFLRLLDANLVEWAGHPEAKEAIVFEYSNWNNPNDTVSNQDALDKIVGDYYFTCHVNQLAQFYADTGNAVYMYYFKQRSTTSPWPKWMGVLHGDEINFIFGEPLNARLQYTQKEVELSRRMMRYWANFARYGTPTNGSQGERWPEYGDKRQYFELNADSARLGRGPRAKQCAFWSYYLPKLVEAFDRNRCAPARPASGEPHPPYQDPFRPGEPHRPPTWAGTSSATSNQSAHLWPPAGSPLAIGLCVILLLLLVGALLVYARRTGKLELGGHQGAAPD